ncbi:hypothetical protein NECAME_18910 [Necator americanus]|uniref:Uncharacterized protein n=1 Tax=Necator americanus TaxID=51031 RepID=W2SRI8_NECAM|nr:hypothetical protein NECAME_18910 [Necator americanus]ETN72344.1 hypothetical protein NECAME_18910 [Necator americanus]
MLLLALTYILPEGMTAKLELVRKDEIDSEQYIMLIHTYRCSKYQILPPTEEGMKFGKIEDDRSRSRNPGTASETERAELMGGQVIV